MPSTRLRLRQPDDWHVHFRDGPFLSETVNASARWARRAIAMPNLIPPITNVQMALDYADRLRQANRSNANFEPLTTLYLTDETTREDIVDAYEAGIVAAKLYPAGATTNAESAVNDFSRLNDVFRCMSDIGMLLLVHGEVTDVKTDLFDREALFIKQIARPLLSQFPKLRMVLEHITTTEAVEFVRESYPQAAATITPQHLYFNRNHLFAGGLRPHNYCLPILKRDTHQQSLQQAAISGEHCFFLGTDSAPHSLSNKLSDCGCAGCYSAPLAIELYTHIFDSLGALDKLENFASRYGAEFYRMPLNTESIELRNEPWQVANEIELDNHDLVVPLLAGEKINWKLVSTSNATTQEKK